MAGAYNNHFKMLSLLKNNIVQHSKSYLKSCMLKYTIYQSQTNYNTDNPVYEQEPFHVKSKISHSIF